MDNHEPIQPPQHQPPQHQPPQHQPPQQPLYPPIHPIQLIQLRQPIQPLSGLRSTRDILGLINTLMIHETIITRARMMGENTEPDVPEDSIRGVSEVFLNNLDEFTVDSEFANKEVQCSICLDEFKEGDKCIRLPCKSEPHIFHSGSDSCSGVKPWLARNNTCPMCRHEFPIDNQPVRPPSLIPTSNITLTPGQIAGLAYSNIDNVVPDMNDNNIIEEQILFSVDNYLREISDLVQSSLPSEDDDLQRAIELSLNDINEE
jgi:hypothetical protein